MAEAADIPSGVRVSLLIAFITHFCIAVTLYIKWRNLFPISGRKLDLTLGTQVCTHALRVFCATAEKIGQVTMADKKMGTPQNRGFLAITLPWGEISCFNVLFWILCQILRLLRYSSGSPVAPEFPPILRVRTALEILRT